ncbi:MAG: efflux RND transporter periplasmic adaptor subunit [Pseudomonadota bacterium]|nr:efflux RND transporter periplasmic adaptor subunit [Pseudomonadota bacterium]
MKIISYNKLLVLLPGLLLPGAVTAFEYDCMMVPHQVVEIKSTVDGIIEAINVERSDFVTKGQPLVVFESDVEKTAVKLARAKFEMSAELDSSKASHLFAVRKLDRFNDLAEKGAVADQTRDEVQTEAVLARLQIVQAKENKRLAELELERALAILNLHTVNSPLTGVLVERFMSPGEYAEGETIMRLAQLDPLNIEVLLPASMFNNIKPGMKARVTPESPLEGSYTVEVKVVDRIVDASSGIFGVRLELPNPENKLPGGLKCTVSFDGTMPATMSRNSKAIGQVDMVRN